jgi:nucleotide-binding universal stress UspA family protein
VTPPETEHVSKQVIVALADDAAAPVVLTTAAAIADLYGAAAQAVHVGEESAALAAAARSAGIPLRTVAGSSVEVLARAAAADDVAAVVIGARGSPNGKRPAGGTALALITALGKPVVVVPAAAAPGLEVKSVLVPLDGTTASAAALRDTVEFVRNAQAEITVAHVRSEESLPAFSDHLPHEVRAWSEEFIARYCPSAADAMLELRVEDGKPEEQVLDILRRSRCDLVALGWSQDLSAGRAAVVRRMLAESPVPVLLTPVSADPAFAMPTD